MEAAGIDHSLEKFGCKGDMGGDDMSRVYVLFCSFWKWLAYAVESIARIQDPEVENRREKG